MSMKSKIISFFSSSRQYAVAGASNNPSKFGYKILNWYILHDLPVIPINPKEQEILGKEVVSNVTQIINAIENHKDILSYKTSQADGLSISFLTPPAITAKTLEEISKIEGYDKVIKGLWFQPGSYDQTVLELAEKIGEFDKVVHEDECILVRGEEGMISANL
ncbi:conserved hypothetical protein [Candida tropicalis MYA-3404]|uniref:CoA-binding domain-containing protein n=1 Tax=Candida tropicalis (strain ATCC MYA-3404 / T1) TaxID=294747 RepID=C5MBJ5_CANTT|nr:conserved hypothetical protein [Candida tropicalis MYA-3404]EER33012.1 conserved hypothetical protein [Candida tropicalis MYA-3404]KAG4406840.1 hypothetical protein JTP64_004224 [Candida tropicalis]